MKPITFMVNVRNEAPRISMILAHARKWADEIIVIDKGSTDDTTLIASCYPGVKIIEVPERHRYGDEDRVNWVNFPHNDWIYIGTPSEIPTLKCIEKCKELVDGDYDLITVPRKMYMLGRHFPQGPWRIANYKFLINRKRTLVSNKIHNNFSAKHGKEGHVPFADDCCVYHLTYTSAKYWLETNIDYWQLEAEGSTNYQQDIDICMARIRQYDQIFKNAPIEMRLQWYGWVLYNMGTAFCLEEKRSGIDIKSIYKQIQDKLMKEWDEKNQ